VPCRFNGGVVVNVDRFRTGMGGWVRLLFKNVNGSPISRVEFSRVRPLVKPNAGKCVDRELLIFSCM
jgi:hypothetical protein